MIEGSHSSLVRVWGGISLLYGKILKINTKFNRKLEVLQKSNKKFENLNEKQIDSIVLGNYAIVC